MTTITITDADRRFSELIDRVRYMGESFILTKHGREVAKLVPCEPVTSGGSDGNATDEVVKDPREARPDAKGNGAAPGL
jgi:prevent-host-death family protein